LSLKEDIPFDTGRYIFIREGKPHGLTIVFKPEALMEVGVLQKITEIIARHGIPILHIYLSRPIEEKHFAIQIIINISDESILRDVLKEIEKIEFVGKVIVKKPLFDGLYVDTLFFPLMVGDQRSILLRKALYEPLFKGVVEAFGTGGAALLYHSGVLIGRNLFKNHKEIAASNDPDKIIQVSEAFASMVGLAKIKVLKYDIEKGTAIVIMRDSFECALYKNENSPRSNFMKGLLAGWFSELFKREVRAQELSCIAMGDEYCEIHVHP